MTKIAWIVGGLLVAAALIAAAAVGITKGVGAYQDAQAETGAILDEVIATYGEAGWDANALRPFASPELAANLTDNPRQIEGLRDFFIREAGAFERLDRAACTNFAANTSLGQGRVATAQCNGYVVAEKADIDFAIVLQGLGEGWRLHGINGNVRYREDDRDGPASDGEAGAQPSQ